MEKITKSITIGLTADDQAAISISPDIECSLAFQMLGTLSLHILNAFYTVASTDPAIQNLSKSERDAATKGIKESMYDAFDSIVSSVLNTFYPDNPALTLEDEAILELTNRKIEEAYNALPASERTKYAQAYAKMKNQMFFREKVFKHDESEGSETSDTTTSEPASN